LRLLASGINIILAIIEKHVCGHVNVQKTIYVNNNNAFSAFALLQFNEQQEEARSVVLQHWYKYVFGPISVGQHCCRPTNNVGWL